VVNDGYVSERIAILPNVESRACSNAAERKNGDHQIDETLLNNPPIECKTSGLIPNHCLNRLGKCPRKLGSGVSPIGVGRGSPAGSR